jgi:hypothetical protein
LHRNPNNREKIGALEYPHVYYVDPRHPASTDEPGWGYPAVPLKTLARACELAQTGDTIVVRGGVYREVLRPQRDGLTIQAMKGEKVIVSGADSIEGWQRATDGSWSAPLRFEPKKVLCDNQPCNNFKYDDAAHRIIVHKDDPRLHLYEVIIRQQGIVLEGRKDIKMLDISSINTLAQTGK